MKNINKKSYLIILGVLSIISMNLVPLHAAENVNIRTDGIYTHYLNTDGSMKYSEKRDVAKNIVVEIIEYYANTKPDTKLATHRKEVFYVDKNRYILYSTSLENNSSKIKNYLYYKINNTTQLKYEYGTTWAKHIDRMITLNTDGSLFEGYWFNQSVVADGKIIYGSYYLIGKFPAKTKFETNDAHWLKIIRK